MFAEFGAFIEVKLFGRQKKFELLCEKANVSIVDTRNMRSIGIILRKKYSTIVLNLIIIYPRQNCTSDLIKIGRKFFVAIENVRKIEDDEA